MLKPCNRMATLIIGAASLSSISTIASAACSRDDVEFYLSKGFSTDQITTLCGQSQSIDHSSKKTSNEQDSQTKNKPAETDTEIFLKEAIKGRNIVLTSDTLSYTLKNCIQYGEEDMYGFAPEACPNVRFELALKNLEIKDPVKKLLFFKADKIEVEGTISRQIVDGLENYKPEDQKKIIQHLESGKKTLIPVRDDISIEQVIDKLEQLVK